MPFDVLEKVLEALLAALGEWVPCPLRCFLEALNPLGAQSAFAILRPLLSYPGSQVVTVKLIRLREMSTSERRGSMNATPSLSGGQPPNQGRSGSFVSTNMPSCNKFAVYAVRAII